ncbi:MAG: TrmH family RNA methyltransferase [Gemmataceae bacterium]
MLTSLQNPLVKQMRRLHEAKGRRQQGVFLVEGTHLIEAALVAVTQFETICSTPTWQTRHPQLWQQAKSHSQRAETVSDQLLGAIATTVHPDGVVATLPRNAVHTHLPTNLNLGVAFETLQDPGNLGTIIRTASAAGADGLWLSPDSVDLDHPKVLRASAGQWFTLPMAVSEDLAEKVRACQQTGVQTIATRPEADRTYWEIDLTKPTLFLLGNEGAGLSAELVDIADEAIRIPLEPAVESLNVAITTALVLYEARRQRTRARK